MSFLRPLPLRFFFARLLGLATILAVFIPGAVFALDKINPTGPGHLAVRGTDTTSYFTQGRPLAGTTSHVVRWNGATWRFGSETEAAQFRANPTAYAPQFGAYCTGGLAARHVVEGKPQHYRLHGGKLYLFHTAAGAKRFSGDPAGMIAKAKDYWAELGME